MATYNFYKKIFSYNFIKAHLPFRLKRKFRHAGPIHRRRFHKRSIKSSIMATFVFSVMTLLGDGLSVRLCMIGTAPTDLNI